MFLLWKSWIGSDMLKAFSSMSLSFPPQLDISEIFSPCQSRNGSQPTHAQSHYQNYKHRQFEFETLRPIDRTPGKPGSDKNESEK